MNHVGNQYGIFFGKLNGINMNIECSLLFPDTLLVNPLFPFGTLNESCKQSIEYAIGKLNAKKTMPYQSMRSKQLY